MSHRANLARLNQAANQMGTAADLFALLRAYYDNAGSLYNDLAQMAYLRTGWRDSIQSLRNPTFSLCQFYVDHLWPGTLPDALPIEVTERGNQAIIEAIHQVWQWSDWAANKDEAALWLPMLGEWFLKVAQSEDGQQVHFQLLDPAYVTDFDESQQGFVTYVRIDTPQRVRQRDALKTVTHTEVWDRASQTYRLWVHDSPSAPIEALGTPKDERLFQSMGIDFVPIVHCKFQAGSSPTDLRGMAAITPHLPDIDESNRQASSLYRKLFRGDQVNWVVTRTGVDAQNRPLPPLRIDDADENGAVVQVGDERFYNLPTGGDMKSIVPQLDYAGTLAILQDYQGWLEQKMPELRFYNISDKALSGKALSYLLGPAVKRAERVRANAERALVRANQMALSIGQAAGLPLFQGLGTYDAGSFDHVFAKRDILPVDNHEAAATALAEAQAATSRLGLGWSQQKVQRELGLTDAEIATMQQEKAAEQTKAVAHQAAVTQASAPPPPAPEQGGTTVQRDESQLRIAVAPTAPTDR
ncbi:MAG TPA: phage portal protein [Chloroflexota bacterium]|nr:phage portal protein [Chloroflexota bacterium]